MKVVMISTDRNIGSPHSAVSKRMAEYGSIVKELHIILFTNAAYQLGEGIIAPNVHLYPTLSRSKFFYILDAIRIGKKVLSSVYFGQTVITAQDPFETGLVGVALKGFAKTGLQIQIHTDAWGAHYRYANFLNWFRVTILARLTLPHADTVRAVSEKVRSDAVIFGHVPPKKIALMPVYVDVFAFAHAPVTIDLKMKYKQWSVVTLMASRLTKEKNVLLALKAFARVVKRYPKAGLVIVGTGSELPKLRRFVAWHKLEENVVFEEWQHDLSSYFQTADIFLNTSLYEGYGMSLVEAGASGTAVLTSKVGIAMDLLEDGRNALICPIGDGNCVYNKLVNLIENPLIRRSLGVELKSTLLLQAITKEVYLDRMKTSFEATIPQ